MVGASVSGGLQPEAVVAEAVVSEAVVAGGCCICRIVTVVDLFAVFDLSSKLVCGHPLKYMVFDSKIWNARESSPTSNHLASNHVQPGRQVVSCCLVFCLCQARPQTPVLNLFGSLAVNRMCVHSVFWLAIN